MDFDDKMSVIYYVILGGMLITLLFSRRLKLSQAFTYALGWIGVFGVLILVYSFKEDAKSLWNRFKSTLIPYTPIETSEGLIHFTRDKNGHFQVEALVNGQSIRFMVDTGATRTTLTLADAKSLGINADNLAFDQITHTASGKSINAAITLDSVKIGTIVTHNVPANVSQKLTGRSLLGMSFLERLKGYKVEGDRLTFWR